MRDIKVINPLDQEQWDRSILATDRYSVFHSHALIKVLRESFGYKPYFFVRGANSDISAMLPLMEVDSAITGRRSDYLPFSYH